MRIFSYLLIALVVFIVFSCENRELTYLNIVKDGTFAWEEKEPCMIIYSDSKNSAAIIGKIKCRGGVSSKYYKHSFSIELERKYSFRNLPYDDDWIINANYIDKTFMRHKISYDLFSEMSTTNIASKSSYINLSINDVYEGLYVLMEQINASMIGLNKKDTLAMLFKDPPIFTKKKMKYIKDSTNYYQQKFPKINNSDKTYYLEKFKDFLFSSTNNQFSKEVYNWVDIENVIDWHIILLLTNNGDGIMKNFYLYKLDEKTPFRFAIWDYDHSFGREGDNEINLIKELNCNRSILLERLSNISEIGYLQKLKSRWFNLRRKNIISIENFEKHIINNDKVINGHIKKNFIKWPVNSKWYYDDNDYLQELDLMRDYIRIRVNQLDKYFNLLNT